MYWVEERGTIIDIDVPFKRLKELALCKIERAYLTELLTRYRGNLSRAAHHAGISRQHLRTLVSKHELKQR